MSDEKPVPFLPESFLARCSTPRRQALLASAELAQRTTEELLQRVRASAAAAVRKANSSSPKPPAS